ncbi:hypothetical protein [Pseudomonas sp. nanlin1]|uniref:hypothetical protein n=1 Tax=Pseudomonas sp. nanlin1 TaxID=3040605 RepID=UPI00388E8322
MTPPSAASSAADLLPAPTFKHRPNLEGGQVNLIAVQDVARPLRVEVAPWPTSQPSPALPEWLRVFVNGQLLAEKKWVAPIAPEDHFVDISLVGLVDGVHSVTYVVTSFSGTPQGSELTPLTLDRRAPQLLIDNAPQFPAEVVSAGITEAYLASNHYRVRVNVPSYLSPAVGDVLRLHWTREQLPGVVIAEKILTLGDKDQPVFFTLEEAPILEHGYGDFIASFSVTDHAGNPSSLSHSSPVRVVKRTLPEPEVEGAQRVDGHLELPALKAVRGALIHIPAAADLNGIERVSVRVGVPGEWGASTLVAPLFRGSRTYRLAPAQVAALMNKNVTLDYAVVVRGRVLYSTPRVLKIVAVPAEHLPIIQCPLAAGKTLRLSQLPAGDVLLRLASWVFGAPGQCINAQARVDTQPPQENSRQVLADQMPIDLLQSFLGVDLCLPRDWLASLAPDTTVHLDVALSFDGGISYLALEPTQILLQA